LTRGRLFIFEIRVFFTKKVVPKRGGLFFLGGGVSSLANAKDRFFENRKKTAYGYLFSV